MRETLFQRMIDSLSSAPPALVKRDVHLPKIPGKAIAVVGVRRGGKTSFLWQCLAERLASGTPREALLVLGLEDDRLAGVTAADLSWLLEEYFRLYPLFRDRRTVTWFLDEIQLVAGWEQFARRVMDTERVDLFLSGSSAKLLSREVATGMRGRALEATVYPFSFREVLRRFGVEPDIPWERMTKSDRTALEHRLRAYLIEGGFPEAQGLDARDRAALMSSYVDVMVLRDVIERHAISNPLALRWLQRHLLASPAGMFSIQKYYDALRSQGIAAGKDSLHAWLAHFEDAFLIQTIGLHTASERQRMVNPRKVYPIDPALIALYERSGRANLGHALETSVMIELRRRGYELAYVKTPEGGEVDFHASAPGRDPLLIQVTATMQRDETCEREVRALVSAAKMHPEATPLLITLDGIFEGDPLPAPLQWVPAAAWLLG